MAHFLFFGTHPRLSLAELKAVAPHLDATKTVATCAIVTDPTWDGQRLMSLLGGTVKLGDILETVPTDEVDAERLVELMIGGLGSRQSESRVTSHESRVKQSQIPNSKFQIPSTIKPTSIDFGLTIVCGSSGTRKTLERLPLQLKRALKARDIRSRWVTAEDGGMISPAAVAKLKLTTEGWDLVLIAEGGNVHIGKTTHVQDADAWSHRDYGRPARDDREGMLPPKLARIMVNLARVTNGETVFDPFCGNGTVLMETALATEAYTIIGSDLEQRQVSTTESNDAWLVEEGILSPDDASRFKTFACDARRVSVALPHASIDAIVTEGTLGPPLRGHESLQAIERTKEEIEDLWRTSLLDWKKMLSPTGRIVGVWPSFKTENGLARVGLDADLAKLGYEIVNPLEGWDDSGDPLVYHRQGQKVARRIVILRKV
jgi:tRNA G10  N-methylase Trm11